MNNEKVLLITGASGFIGTWLANTASEAGYTLLGIDIHGPFRPNIWAGFATSSCETADFDQLIQGRTVDAVFHLAGGASVASSVTNPFGDFSSLLPGTARLALYLAKAQPNARLHLFSSAAVYGNPVTQPITENTPTLPISPYGAHKLLAEDLLVHYSRVFGVDVTVFRIFSVYGAGLRKQLIWDVGQKLLTAIQDGKSSITLFGTGNESRDFIYIKDLCKAVLGVMNHPNLPKTAIYNMASGQECRISQVAQSLKEQLAPNIRLDFNGVIPKGDPANWQADISKLEETGFKADYSLEQGLKEVAEWIKEIQNL